MEKDTIMAKVEIHAGPHRIVSLMSAEAADELGLVDGCLCRRRGESNQCHRGRPPEEPREARPGSSWPS